MDTGVEGRGFIFGPPIAMAIGAKFVPMRKPKKLPGMMARTQKNKATAHHLDLLKNQLAELTNQKQQQQVASGGDKKRRKLVVVSQNCIEPLQALCHGSKEVMSMKGQSADKRRDIATLRKKRKEEKIVNIRDFRLPKWHAAFQPWQGLGNRLPRLSPM
uniref:adenine phosphoribosyltransferase n=1 Tax=Brassica campestris TaxID=3711 RepID=M4D6C0_BRACM